VKSDSKRAKPRRMKIIHFELKRRKEQSAVVLARAMKVSPQTNFVVRSGMFSF
jgi:hypothetical protein